MREHKSVIIILLMFALFCAASLVYADNGHGHDHGGGGGDSTSDSFVNADLGNTVTGDSLSLGLAMSYGMGDVDINEGKNCMGSEQRANVLFGKQKMSLNPWCASLFYELNGKHNFAAKLRCKIPEIGEQYSTTDECVLDQDLSPVPNEKVADIFEEQRIQDEYIASVQMQQNSIENRLQKLERRPASVRGVVQEPWMTEERRAKLQAVLDEDE